MFDQYKGLSTYNHTVRAVFALSAAVKNGFNFSDFRVMHGPEDVCIEIDILKDALRNQGCFLSPDLGIYLDEHDIQQILSVSKDRLVSLGGVATLPGIERHKTVTYDLSMNA